MIETRRFAPGSTPKQETYFGAIVRWQELEPCGVPACSCNDNPMSVAFIEDDGYWFGMVSGPISAIPEVLEGELDCAMYVDIMRSAAILFGTRWHVVERNPLAIMRRQSQAATGMPNHLAEAPLSELRRLRESIVNITDPVCTSMLLNVLELPYDFRN